MTLFINNYKKEELVTIIMNGREHMALRNDGHNDFQPRIYYKNNRTREYNKMMATSKNNLQEQATSVIEFCEKMGNIEQLINASISGQLNQKAF